MVDLTKLDKAIHTLQDVFRMYDENPLREDAPEKIVIRDAAIKRFEFTFELAWKTLKRFLEEHGQERVDILNNKDLFRVGFEQGLIDDPVKWFDYLKQRNLTSHVYDDAVAHKVFLAARNLISDASSLLARMQERNS